MASALKRRLGSYKFEAKFTTANLNQLKRARARAEARLGGGEVEIVPEDADTLIRKFKSEWAENRDLNRLSRRIRRWFPHLLFYPLDTPDQWLASNSAIQVAVGEYVEDPRHTRALVSLCYAFLRAFPIGSPVFKVFSGFCETSIERNTKVRSLAMREASTRFRLFSEDGPTNAAKFWLESTSDFTSPTDMPELSIMSPGSDSQFAHHLANAFLRSVPDYLNEGGSESPDRLEKKLSLVPGVADNASSVAPDLRKPFAEALLDPFHKIPPPEVYKRWARPFLLRHLSDPRRRPEIWSEISESARAVMLRWLVEETLDQFFHVLDKTAVDRMWQTRRKFWEGYLKQGAISQAWVVLGSDAARFAKRSFDEQPAFGRLEGAANSQSVLLMELGPSLVVAEWSHNGACQFWDRRNESAPALFKRAYNARTLRSDLKWRVVHIPADNPKSWQRKIEKEIYRKTKIRGPSGRLAGWRG